MISANKKALSAITGIEIFFFSSPLTGLYRSQNFSGVVDVFFFVDLFDVEKDKISILHKLQPFGIKSIHAGQRSHCDLPGTQNSADHTEWQ